MTSALVTLWREARKLEQVAPRWNRCPAVTGGRPGFARPALLFFTDPVRTPDAAAVIARLPRGSAVVYRAFGAVDSLAKGKHLVKAARRRGVMFLVGADPGLATVLNADGVHLPERLAHRAGAIRDLRRRFLVTAAAHSLPAIIRARRAGVTAVVVSAVFPSASPSAGRPLGALRFVGLVHAARLPVYALGGVDAATAPRLRRSGASGLAAVSAMTGHEGASSAAQIRT